MSILKLILLLLAIAVAVLTFVKIWFPWWGYIISGVLLIAMIALMFRKKKPEMGGMPMRNPPESGRLRRGQVEQSRMQGAR
jgi:hypothetical protein